MKNIMKKSMIAVVAVSVLISLFSGANVFAEGTTGVAGEMLEADTTQGKYGEYDKEIAKKYPNAIEPADILAVNGADYSDTNVKDILQPFEQTGIATPDNGFVEYTFDVKTEGRYNIVLKYRHIIDAQLGEALKGKRSSVVRAIAIDGVEPFFEAKNVTISRVWKDDLPNGVIERDENDGNDKRPFQIETDAGWLEEPIGDYMGYYSEPFSFYFTKGEHKIRFTAIREPIIIGEVRLQNTEEIPTYVEASKNYPAATGSAFTTIQAELASLKSESMFYATYDRTSPMTYPQSASKLRRNTIGGGGNWSSPGDWIEWEFTVPTTGLYRLAMRARQNFSSGVYVTRKVYIDGQVPFKEAEAMKISYNNNWQTVEFTDANNKPYYIYLEAGKTHTIRMECTLGDLATIIRRAEACLAELQKAYREIFALTGATPDDKRDYDFRLRVPGALKIFKEQEQVLKQLQKDIIAQSGEIGEKTTTLARLERELKQMTDKPAIIATRFSSFYDMLGSMSSWIMGLRGQPLELDTITFAQADYQLPKPDANGWQKFVFEIKKFWSSFFEDYENLGAGNEKSVVIWMGSSTQSLSTGSSVTSGGRDQALIVKELADDYFTKKYGISVNVRLVAGNSLLPATLAGQGPDVSMQTSTTDAINYAIRGAVEPLNNYPGYEEIAKRFNESAIVPMTFNGQVYGLPETEDYPMMFYRKDILADMGVTTLPQTWDEVTPLIRELQKKHMTFGLGNTTNYATTGGSTTSGYTTYLIFLYQNGGKLYNNNGESSALSDKVAIEQFQKFTSYFTQWKLPYSYDFTNRFSMGEMPIGIAPYSSYAQLSVFAPEIASKWDICPIPGTRQPDGSIDRSAAGGTMGCIMMKQSKNKASAWEFMKWWTEADTQVQYGLEVEAMIGPAARYCTANKEAMDRIPWSSDTLKQLKTQWAYIKGIPEVPGSYYTSRNVDFAFRDVVISNENPVESLRKYVREIDEELHRKREEFKESLGLE